MLKSQAKTHHLFITFLIIFTIFSFIFYKVADGVILDPKDAIHHTTVVYYDGEFSETSSIQDTSTALYLLNKSDEVIYATVYEYDRKGREVKNAIQIIGQQTQFIKTEGPGVIYLNNSNSSASSTIKFSRWAKFKKFNW